MFLQIFGTTTCWVCYNSLISNVQKRCSGTWKYTKANYQDGKLLKNLPYNERLKKLGIPSLECRRLRADVIEVYKTVNQIDRISIDKFFTINDEISTRGNGLNFIKKWSRLNVQANMFSNRCEYLELITKWSCTGTLPKLIQVKT